MKKVLILFCVTLFVATAAYASAQGMMSGRAFPIHHHIMHPQNIFCHKAAADIDSNSIRKDHWIQGEFALDDSPAIADEALKKALGYKKIRPRCLRRG
jgi:hypothetical protein